MNSMSFTMVQQKHINSPTSGGVRLISSRRLFTINRDPANGFGLNVVGGIDAPHIPGYNGIFISKVRRLDLDGINEGDQILSVNGIELANKTHAEVLKILREASNNSTFMIEVECGAKNSIATI
uniref:PDZ domain-containing protein n=1 Tax=Globodera rostochiensis TaxID=31243 RepID=A0A914HIX9_GLORO